MMQDTCSFLPQHDHMCKFLCVDSQHHNTPCRWSICNRRHHFHSSSDTRRRHSTIDPLSSSFLSLAIVDKIHRNNMWSLFRAQQPLHNFATNRHFAIFYPYKNYTFAQTVAAVEFATIARRQTAIAVAVVALWCSDGLGMQAALPVSQ